MAHGKDAGFPFSPSLKVCCCLGIAASHYHPGQSELFARRHPGFVGAKWTRNLSGVNQPDHRSPLSECERLTHWHLHAFQRLPSCPALEWRMPCCDASRQTNCRNSLVSCRNAVSNYELSRPGPSIPLLECPNSTTAPSRKSFGRGWVPFPLPSPTSERTRKSIAAQQKAAGRFIPRPGSAKVPRQTQSQLPTPTPLMSRKSPLVSDRWYALVVRRAQWLGQSVRRRTTSSRNFRLPPFLDGRNDYHVAPPSTHEKSGTPLTDEYRD